MIRHILFATDFSPISTRAEEYVTQIAKGDDLRVILLHAIEPIAGMTEDEEGDHLQRFMTNLKTKAKAKAKVLVERFSEQGIETEVVVEIKARWKAIIDCAESENVDLIVIGSHAIQEDGKMYIGTTSHKVFFSTDKPLMVVPQG